MGLHDPREFNPVVKVIPPPEVKIHSKYKCLREELTRYTILTGGRGSGKSFAVAVNLLLLTYEQGHVILFTRYTMASAGISIIPEFLQKMEMLGLTSDFEITKTEIINKRTGSKILFRGIKASSGIQTANLKSISGVTTWVLDEAEELVDEAVFNTINESIRVKGIQNRVIFILNPTTKVHWIYDRFFVRNGVNDGANISKGDTSYIHTTYLDNIENLDASFIKIAEDEKVRCIKSYNNRFLGAWLDKAEGVIFNNWEIGDYVSTQSEVYGQDYGFIKDASTLVQVSVDHGKNVIYVKECFYTHGMSTGQIYESNKLHAGKDRIIGDSAEPRLIKELKVLGNFIEGCKKGPGSINFGIKLMQGYRIIVCPSSINLIEELNNYAWKKGSKEEPIDNFNHLIDAFRYALTYLVESKRRRLRVY